MKENLHPFFLIHSNISGLSRLKFGISGRESRRKMLQAFILSLKIIELHQILTCFPVWDITPVPISRESQDVCDGDDLNIIDRRGCVGVPCRGRLLARLSWSRLLAGGAVDSEEGGRCL